MNTIRPLSSYGSNARDCYFSEKVVRALQYAQTPACKHLDDTKNKDGITDCQLLVAMTEAERNLLKFLGLRDGAKGPTDVLRKKLGIVPTPLKEDGEADIPILEANDKFVSYKEMNDILADDFVRRVLFGAGGMDDHPRIAYMPEMLSSLGAYVYATVPIQSCSTEVNDLLFECTLATAKEFTERAKKNKIILPPVSMTSFVFPYDIEETYQEGIPVFADLKASYLKEPSDNGKA